MQCNLTINLEGPDGGRLASSGEEVKMIKWVPVSLSSSLNQSAQLGKLVLRVGRCMVVDPDDSELPTELSGSDVVNVYCTCGGVLIRLTNGQLAVVDETALVGS